MNNLRESSGRSGGFARAAGRVFGEGENPLSWSLPMAVVRGVSVRLHLVFVVFIAVRLVQSIQQERAGLLFQAAGLAGLLVLVLVHEASHVAAAVRSGVRHDRIVLWPLGGFDHGEQTLRPGQLAAIAAAGPIASLVMLVPLSALTLWMTGSWDLVLFDPFDYRDAARAASAESLGAWLVWSLHANNAMLLAFNLLVPMHPLDAGRLVQASLWAARGEAGAARLSGTVGLVSAAVLAAIGLTVNETVLLGVAVIGAFVSWQEMSRARFLDLDAAGGARAPDAGDDSWDSGPPDADELDRILQKISRQGLESLTSEERRALDRASAAGTDAPAS